MNVIASEGPNLGQEYAEFKSVIAEKSDLMTVSEKDGKKFVRPQIEMYERTSVIPDAVTIIAKSPEMAMALIFACLGKLRFKVNVNPEDYELFVYIGHIDFEFSILFY